MNKNKRDIIGLICLVLILLIIAFLYGEYKEYIGELEGAYAVLGDEGMCEFMEGYNLNNVCVVEISGNIQYDISCSWGRYRYYLAEDKEPGFFLLLSLDLLRCRLVR